MTVYKTEWNRETTQGNSGPENEIFEQSSKRDNDKEATSGENESDRPEEQEKMEPQAPTEEEIKNESWRELLKLADEMLHKGPPDLQSTPHRRFQKGRLS
ncbi:hypothetical protein FQA39_LY12216 [Lamprigera yunnana]|nr:hypothetical protein FQA39_LY12216 [Lamprigera yunnana]